jgi:hypothetical protein
VHDQFSLHEVEAVGNGLEGTLDHLLLEFGAELGQFVDGLEGVLGVGHAEGHFELEGLDEVPLEVVLLDHEELLDRLRADLELQRGADVGQFEEVRPELVLHEPHWVRRLLPDLALRFSNLK